MNSMESYDSRLGWVNAVANQLRMENYMRGQADTNVGQVLRVEVGLVELQAKVKAGDANEAEQTLQDVKAAMAALKTAVAALRAKEVDVPADVKA